MVSLRCSMEDNLLAGLLLATMAGGVPTPSNSLRMSEQGWCTLSTGLPGISSRFNGTMSEKRCCMTFLRMASTLTGANICWLRCDLVLCWVTFATGRGFPIAVSSAMAPCGACLSLLGKLVIMRPGKLFR